MLNVLRPLTWWFAVVGSAIALAVGVMTTVSVVGRAFFKSPIQGDIELTQLGIALSISLCIPWCQLRGANIIVDFFTQNLSTKKQGFLDAIGAALVALMCLLLAWRTGAGALAVREAQESSMILGLPMWWAYASLAPGLALGGLVALVQAWMRLTDQALVDADNDAQREPS
jgi:TRAP-type C4-dicarboxylate transport system permease small subunit